MVTVYVNAPAGLIYPGDPGFPRGETGLNKQWLNFSPRVGLGWDVSGNGKTAVRTSYGLTYDFPNAEYQLINANSPPYGNRSIIEDPPGLFDHPYAAVTKEDGTFEIKNVPTDVKLKVVAWHEGPGKNFYDKDETVKKGETKELDLKVK